MKVAVIGATGQLGSDLHKELHTVSLFPLTHTDIEITSLDSVKQALHRCAPEVIINTAAFHRVDDCETQPDKAYLVNALGTRNVAVVAEGLGAKLVHISTDYVFGGEPEVHTTPYTEFDTPVPLNVYGRSKLAGEELVRHLCRKHFIVRVSALFGTAGSSVKGSNFIETVIHLAKERPQLTVVKDQVFSPTYTKDLARKIAWLITTEYYGTFHITNKGTCSWYDFAREILRQVGLSTPVIPITSDQYPQKARRPRYSVLDNYHLRLLGADDMRPWQEALTDYLKSKGYIS